MAQRKGQQRQAPASARVRGGTPTRARTSPAQGGDEVSRLKAELAAARQEIADLRALQDEVLNRIDWVIDSLNSLGE